jgi:hypothetical protein
MLDQEVGIERRRNAAPVRLQMSIDQKTIGDLRQKRFLGENEVFSKNAIGKAIMKAAFAGIKATEAPKLTAGEPDQLAPSQSTAQAQKRALDDAGCPRDPSLRTKQSLCR